MLMSADLWPIDVFLYGRQSIPHAKIRKLSQTGHSMIADRTDPS